MGIQKRPDIEKEILRRYHTDPLFVALVDSSAQRAFADEIKQGLTREETDEVILCARKAAALAIVGYERTRDMVIRGK